MKAPPLKQSLNKLIIVNIYKHSKITFYAFFPIVPGSPTVSPVSENENIIGTITPLQENGSTNTCINDDDERSQLLSTRNTTRCYCIHSKTSKEIYYSGKKHLCLSKISAWHTKLS